MRHTIGDGSVWYRFEVTQRGRLTMRHFDAKRNDPFASWRTVGRHGLGQFTPLELDGVLQLLPGKYGTVMDLGLVLLGCGTTILGIGLALIEALAVTVIEGDVTYAGPAVLDYGCGMELGHGFMVLIM